MFLTPLPPARQLRRAKDLADSRYFERLDVATLARAARLSPAHFSREFRRVFGESPHQYLLTRPLLRAPALRPRVPRRLRRVAPPVPADAPARAGSRTATQHRPLGGGHLHHRRAA